MNKVCRRVSESKFTLKLNAKKNLTQDIPTITGINCVFVLLELCWWRLCGPRPPALLSLLLQVVFLLRAVHLGCWDVAWQLVVLMRGRR